MSSKTKRKEYFRTKPVDMESKLKIMKEFKEKTKEEIKGSTVYKGHNIGIWQMNLRNKYLNGNLNISQELEKEFVEAGILSERKRAKQTTDLDKYNILMDFYEENPKIKIGTKTVDKHGNPIGEMRHWLQAKINNGTTELTKEQIDQLKKHKYLRKTREEIRLICKQYKIQFSIAKEILEKYDSIEEFAIAYKQGDTKTEKNKINRRGIILSKNELSIKQKQKYLWLIEDILGEDVLKDNSKFVVEEDIQEAINALKPNEKAVILERYDVSYQKRQTFENIGDKIGLTGTRIKQINENAIRKLVGTLTIYDINEQIDLGNELIRKLENTDFEQWRIERFYSDIDVLDLSDNTKQKLKENGYNTIASICEVDKKKLLDIHGIGSKKIKDILDEVDNVIDNSTEENWKNERKQLSERVQKIIQNVPAYFTALDNYIKQEDIFTLEGTIPPSIKYEGSLAKLKEEKDKKVAKLTELENEIDGQNDKAERLEEILGKNTKNKE